METQSKSFGLEGVGKYCVFFNLVKAAKEMRVVMIGCGGDKR